MEGKPVINCGFSLWDRWEELSSVDGRRKKYCNTEERAQKNIWPCLEVSFFLLFPFTHCSALSLPFVDRLGFVSSISSILYFLPIPYRICEKERLIEVKIVVSVILEQFLK